MLPVASVEIGRVSVVMLELDRSVLVPVAEEVISAEQFLDCWLELLFIDVTGGRVVLDVISTWLVAVAPTEEGVDENCDRPSL